MDDRSTIAPSLIELAIEPRTQRDHDRLMAALARLTTEDPSFHAAIEPESGQIVVCGTTELHLEAKIEALRHDNQLQLRIGAPQVAYRETISKAVTIDYTYKKMSGASGQFARVAIAFEPRNVADGFIFENAISGGSIPADFIPGVEKGLQLQSKSGLLAGFPLIGVKATLLDGAYHDIDSSIATFEIAARAALRELAQKGRPLLLEPMMTVEVSTPDDYLGSVISDLSRRRGKIQSQDARDGAQIVSATVPLANMFGYINSLSSVTQGRGRFTMAFLTYAQLPVSLTDPDDPTFTPAAGARVASSPTGTDE